MLELTRDPFDIPPATLAVAKRLEEAGYETWFVGGAVRDSLLSRLDHIRARPTLEWDVATAAPPDEVRRIFGHRRTVPVGIKYGTVGVFADGRLHEVTTFRRDVRTDGRHAVVEFGGSLQDDLARRDFTINAIAYHWTGRFCDPFGGTADLVRNVVRAVGDPHRRMQEDRLRALRAIRFAGRLRFTIHSATWEAIVTSASHLRRLSPERVKQELEKTMDEVERPSASLRLWVESGAMAALVPSLEHVDGRTLAAVDQVPLARAATEARRRSRRVTRLAALFSELAASQVAASLSALRFSNSDTTAVVTLVDAWHTVGRQIERALAGGSAVDDATLRRWVADIGRLDVPLVMRVACAVWSARRAAGSPAPDPGAVGALYRRLLRSRFRDPLELSDLAVDGDDLRRAGIPPGPQLGKILHALLDRVIRDPSLNAPAWLLEEAKRLYGSGDHGRGSPDTTRGR